MEMENNIILIASKIINKLKKLNELEEELSDVKYHIKKYKVKRNTEINEDKRKKYSKGSFIR